MNTKQCNGECGKIKPHNEFPQKHGKPHGAVCSDCANKARREKHAPNIKRVYGPEQLDIMEKYKNDPKEKTRLLNNLKAKRAREKKNKQFIEGTQQIITEKKCNGKLCNGKIQPVTNFYTQKYADGYQTICIECTKYNDIKKKEQYSEIDLENTTKYCKGCNINHTLNEFDVNAKGKLARNDYCKKWRHDVRTNTHYNALTDGEKKCSECGYIKHVFLFHKDGQMKNGLHSSCKICHNLTQRKC